MPSLSAVLRLLLLWEAAAAQTEQLRCPLTGPVGALHPVQGLLERFEAGPGCAARQRGSTETHVVAVGGAANADDKVTVLLKPLPGAASPLRPLRLLLSSALPVTWLLDAERLPPDLPVLVQVSSGSSVRSPVLLLHIWTLRSVPFQPPALLRWALSRHGNLSSMTHVSRADRVYVGLGEDPRLPPVCRLQHLLSRSHVASHLQPQEVRGCVAPAGGLRPEVHAIKLHSAGSGLGGSLQVEVLVSLVLPAGRPEPQEVVLILSSAVPVTWAVDARGVRGHVSVHSSHSVTPPLPPEPHLSLSSTRVPDLAAVADLLAWARGRGFPQVVSYTEADLANRFVVRLAGGAAGRTPSSPTDGRRVGGASCEEVDRLAAVPGPPAAPADDVMEPSPGSWVPPGPDPDPSRQPGPVLLLKLFVSDRYERRRVGPVVAPANHRIYVELSAEGSGADVVQVSSCVVSPLSDPKKSPFWWVVSEGCSSDASLRLEAKPDEDDEDDEGGTLRFSFVLRPVYNDSVQFLHCSLRLCSSGAPDPPAAAASDCLRIPPLVSAPGLGSPVPASFARCELRNLSRPVVVTRAVTSLAPKAPRPPAGQSPWRRSLPPPGHAGSELQTGALVGVVFLAFVMGVGLTGGMWCIYSRTGGRRGYLTDPSQGNAARAEGFPSSALRNED